MKPEEFLIEAESVRAWRQFMQRVDTMTRRLPRAERDDIRLEIASHLRDSLDHQESADETDRLLLAIGKLGDPDDFVRPMVADRLLTSGGRSFNPKAILVGICYSLYGGARTAAMAVIFGLGYALSFSFAVIAVLKIFFPHHVGLFLNGGNDFLLGAALRPETAGTETLGWWIVPLALFASAFLYVGLTKALRFLKTKRR